MKRFPTMKLVLLRLVRMVACCTVAGAAVCSHGGESGRTYATPEEAVTELGAAINAQDADALRGIFGPAGGDLVNHDPVQASNEFKAFSAAFKEKHELVRESESKCLLEVGDQGWPFPVPIVKEGNRWHFDSEAGREELINRRIGRNELLTLRSMRAYVDAQRDYAAKDRDGDEVLEFAQKIVSAPGKKDGLYWPPDLDGELSPLGPAFAEAQAEGYRLVSSREAEPAPFHGYYFKLLTRQGRHAPGGKYDYIINGNMIGGFALVAWPAEYGDTGVMTFVVNQQGRVYQKDLRPDTARIARKMTEYNPDKTWQVSRE